MLLVETGLMTYADKLRELKKNSGLTEDQIAERSGLKASTVQSYLIGRRDPSIKNMFLLAEVFGVNCEAFRECTSSSDEYKGTGKPGRPKSRRNGK